jgi:hypothetical protein
MFLFYICKMECFGFSIRIGSVDLCAGRWEIENLVKTDLVRLERDQEHPGRFSRAPLETGRGFRMRARGSPMLW